MQAGLCFLRINDADGMAGMDQDIVTGPAALHQGEADPDADALVFHGGLPPAGV
jgi:hypothetical protein